MPKTTTALALLALLALLLPACAGQVDHDSSVGDADQETAPKTPAPTPTQPFAGPCDFTGSWALTFEAVEEPGCWLPSMPSRIVVDGTSVWTPAGSDLVPVDASFSADGCTLTANWELSYDDNDEPQGYHDVLTLEQTAPAAASGTLTHSEYWWCGSMYGSKTYAAHGKRE